MSVARDDENKHTSVKFIEDIQVMELVQWNWIQGPGVSLC